ncbi:putative porin [Sinorhizobium kostiense]|uniref:Porin n=1 Tax=Sinorhizobium kostiense TaxID=76747 RepID=A0ABS4R2L1_9HYPH|nr:hypothetical protein [Sinorhizobium kostiense]MBP2237148.1 putative porin [Sinorhizobium kostiense]
MKTLTAAVLLCAVIGGAAHAATVTNRDGDTAMLVIVEGQSRIDVALASGATETICPMGCFVTLPSGDRIGLQGDETVEIVNGSFVFK